MNSWHLQLLLDKSNKIVFDNIELHNVRRLLSSPEFIKFIEQVH